MDPRRKSQRSETGSDALGDLIAVLVVEALVLGSVEHLAVRANLLTARTERDVRILAALTELQLTKCRTERAVVAAPPRCALGCQRAPLVWTCRRRGDRMFIAAERAAIALFCGEADAAIERCAAMFCPSLGEAARR
jgi:hypothetical protein